MKEPEWLKKSVQVWREDDSLPYDRELLEGAWMRLFKDTLPHVKSALEDFDGGDEISYLFPSDRIAVMSYPGNCSIRIRV